MISLFLTVKRDSVTNRFADRGLNNIPKHGDTIKIEVPRSGGMNQVDC